MGSENETAWIERARKNDREAIRRLVELHRDTAIRIAFRISGDFHSAEDIAQDAFVKAFQKLDQYSAEKGPFGPWLFQIAKNLALNSRRRQRPIPFATVPDTETTSPAPHLRDEMDLLDHALENLNEKFRTPFVLAEIEQLPLATVAQMEDVPIGTIKSRLSRAKESLRASLSELDPNRS